MAYRVVKLNELKEHGLTRNQLNTPCSPEVSRALAMKIDDWKLLVSFIGLSEQDIAAIQEGNRSYETQSLASLIRWRRQFGSKATYLMLAEGLEKIGCLDLAGELCVLCENTLSTKPKGNNTYIQCTVTISNYIREKAFREMKKRCRDDHCSKK